MYSTMATSTKVTRRRACRCCHIQTRADDQRTPGGTVHQRSALEPPVDRRGDALDHTRLTPDFGSALDVISSSRLEDASGAAAAPDDRASVAWPFTVTTVSSPVSPVP